MKKLASASNRMATLPEPTINKYWTYALWLAFFTVFYNLAEGLVSIFFASATNLSRSLASAWTRSSRWD